MRLLPFLFFIKRIKRKNSRWITQRLFLFIEEGSNERKAFYARAVPEITILPPVVVVKCRYPTLSMKQFVIVIG